MLCIERRLRKLEDELTAEDFDIDKMPFVEWLHISHFYNDSQVESIYAKINSMTEEERQFRAERYLRKTGHYPAWKGYLELVQKAKERANEVSV